MAESKQRGATATLKEVQQPEAFEKSRVVGAKRGTGKQRKSSSQAGKNPRSKRPRTPTPDRSTDTENDSSSEPAKVKVGKRKPKQATTADLEKISILQKEIKEMEQDHQDFLLEGRAEFYVVKFEDRPPRNMKSEYACVRSGWVHRRNPLKKNGERSGFVSYPHNETEEEVEAHYHHLGVGLMWNVYKVIFCYSTGKLEEAKQYLSKRVQLDQEMERLDGGKTKAKPKPPYKKRKFMMKVLMPTARYRSSNNYN